MNEEDLEPHKSTMKAGGYRLDDTRFARLKKWHGVLFQLTSAKYYLDQLKGRKPNLGKLEDSYEVMALLSAFILQYSKCFTSGAEGQATLDDHKVFVPGSGALVAHRRILDIRHNLVAHNGNSDLVIPDLGVKEQDDRFVVKHFLTFAIPMNELDAFEEALEATLRHSVQALNKNLDSIGEKLGKIVLLDEA
jgi:hypothetical protein